MARQQLNLINAHFLPQALRCSARHGLLASAAVVTISLALAQGLGWASHQADAKRLQLEAELTQLRPRLATTATAPASSPQSELAQLQLQEAMQRRVRAALDAGAAGTREGHADYLLALARQASSQLWITGFSVSDDGQAIDLEGRMTDSSVLTDYLRKLNAEPRFKGRPFAQLTLHSSDHSGATLPYTEFSLRSSPAPQASTGKP